MKRIVLFSVLALAISWSSCNHKTGDSSELVNINQTAGGTSTSGDLPVMTFETLKHDFGTITQGQQVKYSFKFRNTGGSDLIISDAKGSCGCTVPEYPHKPIPAGESATIDVVFNSEGKQGAQNKTVTLVTNCETNTVILTITGNVLVPNSTK